MFSQEQCHMANFLWKNNFNFQVFPRVSNLYPLGFFTESQHSAFITLNPLLSQKDQSLHHGCELPIPTSYFKFFLSWNYKIPNRASISLYFFPKLTDSERYVFFGEGEEGWLVRSTGADCWGYSVHELLGFHERRYQNETILSQVSWGREWFTYMWEELYFLLPKICHTTCGPFLDHSTLSQWVSTLTGQEWEQKATFPLVPIWHYVQEYISLSSLWSVCWYQAGL